jgi:hypothetical protein
MRVEGIEDKWETKEIDDLILRLIQSHEEKNS